MRKRAALVLTGAVFVGGGVVAGSWDAILDRLEPSTLAWEHEVDLAERRYLEGVAARGDSRSLLAAALIYPPEPVDERFADPEQQQREEAMVRDWWQRSTLVEPVEPSALWLSASRCQSTDRSCDSRVWLIPLMDMDQDNAMVAVALAHEARQRGDVDRANQWFSTAASASRYDAYDRAVGHLLLEAYADFEPPPMPDSLVGPLTKLWLALQPGAGSLPDLPPELRLVAPAQTSVFNAFPDLRTFCPLEPEAYATQPPERNQECRRLFTTMADTATTPLGKSIALRWMVQLSRDDADGQQWRERLRQFRWRMDRYQEFGTATFQTMDYPPDYFRLMLTEGELASMAYAVAMTGTEVEAPADWLPDNPHQRSLILTGTVPD